MLLISAKRLLAAWRVLVGVWGPRTWDLPTSLLKNYTTFVPPKPNPWLDANKPVKEETGPTDASTDAPKTKTEKKVAEKKEDLAKKVPSRALVRHVLRARIVASQSLSAFLAEVEKSGEDVPASSHLASQFGSSISFYEASGAQGEPSAPTTPGLYKFLPTDGPIGTRSAKEVMKYLRDHGAHIEQLDTASEGDWAAVALSSGDEGGAEVRLMHAV